MPRAYSADQYATIIIKVKKYPPFITDTAYYSYFEVKVPAALEFAEKYCNRFFSTKNPNYDVAVSGSEEFILNIPNPVYEYIAKDIELNINGVKSESLGDHSITTTNRWNPLNF